jgi:integrase/recombinase XerC
MKNELKTKQLSALQTWPEAFAGHLRASGKSESTIQSYVADLRAFTLFFEAFNGEGFEPGLLTSWDVREYRKHLVDAHAAAATINRRLASLRAFGAWCTAAGLLTVDPCGEVSGIGKQRIAPRWLGKGDFGRLMRQAERNLNGARSEAARRQALRDRAILALMAYGGLRVSEVCGLRMGDVEISERRGVVRVMGKGMKERTVPLASEARKAVGEWLPSSALRSAQDASEARNDRKDQEQSADYADYADASLWKGKHGAGMTARSVERMISELGRQAGVEATPHRLRHTAAKRMINGGVDVTVVAGILGHERIETTRRYTLPSLEDMAEAVERI